MSTIFEPTKTIKLSQIQSICKKYDELELKDMFVESSDPKEGKNFVIQSSFKQDITHPYTVFGIDFDHIVLNCLKDPSTKDDYYLNYFRMVGQRPYHIVKIIQYETQVVINDEYTIDDFRKYEHFGTEDLSTIGESLWKEMSDEEKEPFKIKLTLDQSEDWLCLYGYKIEENIIVVKNDKTLSEDERKKRLDKLWYQYHYSSPKEYLKQLETV